jgi:hypothetical protein
VQRKASPARATFIQIGAVLAALLGLYFTYQDFRHTASHRWLGERFHLGGYLFWVGWIIISIYHLMDRPRPGLLNDGREIKDGAEADNNRG